MRLIKILKALRSSSLFPNQAIVMVYLHKHGWTQQATLRRKFELDRNLLSQLIRLLYNRGWIEEEIRLEDGVTRRKVPFFRLTQKGEKVIKPILRASE